MVWGIMWQINGMIYIVREYYNIVLSEKGKIVHFMLSLVEKL
jgi:hypothetical protein